MPSRTPLPREVTASPPQPAERICCDRFRRRQRLRRGACLTAAGRGRGRGAGFLMLLMTVAIGGCGLTHCHAQPRTASGRALNLRMTPHWFGNDRFLWYRLDRPNDTWEFVRVRTDTGDRGPAFDHARLADALAEAGVTEADPRRLPLESLQFSPDADAVEFLCDGVIRRCLLTDYTLLDIENFTFGDRPAAARPESVPRASRSTGAETSLTFVNRLEQPVELFWLDTSGQRQSYGTLPAGQRRNQHTFAGHVWEAVADGQPVGRFVGAESHALAVIDGEHLPRFRSRRRERSDDRSPQRRDEWPSPDGRFTAVLRDANPVLIRNDSGEEQPLTTTGTEERPFGRLSWSPDSRCLAAFRTTPADPLPVYRIESSPDSGGRAVLHTQGYRLPGDDYPVYELALFDAESGTPIACDIEPFDFGTPRIRWNPDSSNFTIEKTDRGHQRFRVLRIQAQTGAVDTLIDERSDTFLWTAHTEQLGVRRVTWLKQSDELIVVSERDGWRHLYLVNAETGDVINPITEGSWVVRQVDRIDEEQRQIWFRAGGIDSDQDPYHVHFCRIDFDGRNLVRLTEGDGTHSVQYSPGGDFLVDTWSRVDQPPRHELRRTTDGSLVCPLADADISALTAQGFRTPEVFCAKGRDGDTDIWGMIVRPSDWQPDRRYPVLEDIYAGPHGAHVPKSFSPGPRYRDLTEAGFIVVKIDGMGTAHRSKAFHDVCWQNLKDAGFPDRIAWLKAAATKSPDLDISRVGIFGTSAGGQNAAAAVLFHADFYDAAFAACGCHDNRMDKASWNEQWMGYPVGPQYAASSNIENADRLGGHLMLLVGEMDSNVPPESTLRFADALIQADKDFELLVIPGMGHSSGGRYGRRRMREFFVRHLHPDATTAARHSEAD